MITTNASMPVTIWTWDNNDPFGANTANSDPDGDTVLFTYNIRLPGQYIDSESGLHYNYFRDYDPSVGRYTTSDPIGLGGGLSTYGYVGSHPIYSIDPLGWLELCKKIIADEWREIARKTQIIDYKSLSLTNDIAGNIIDAVTTIKPGWSVGKKIPIYQDVSLNRQFKVRYEVCKDECTGKETSSRKLGENAQDIYKEFFFNNPWNGEPIWVGPGPDPSFETRWGYGKTPRP